MNLLVFRAVSALRKAVSRNIGPDLYALTVSDGRGNLKEVQGHWRSIHGHRIFIATDGTVYARDFDAQDGDAPVYRPHTNADWLQQHAQEYPALLVEGTAETKREVADEVADEKRKYNTPPEKARVQALMYGGGWRKMEVKGLTLDLARELLDHIPSGRRYEDIRSAAKRFVDEWEDRRARGEEGHPQLEGYSAAWLPEFLHHAVYDDIAASVLTRESPSNTTTWKNQTTSVEAKRRQQGFGLAVGAHAAEYHAWVKEREDAAAEASALTAEAEAQGLERLRKFPVKAWMDELRSKDTGSWDSTPYRPNVLKLYAAALDAGLVRMVRDRVRSDEKRCREVLAKGGPAAKVAAMALLGWKPEGWAGSNHDSHAIAEKAGGDHVGAYSIRRASDMIATAYQHSRNSGKRMMEGGIEISNDLFQNLAANAELAQAVAKGDNTAVVAITPEGLKANIDELLDAQEDGTWTPPKLLTMSGYYASGGKRPEVRTYQVKGVNWALKAKRGINGFGTGLGKTLVMLATALKLNETGAVKRGVIICPKKVMSGFAEEIAKACPKAKVVFVDGTKEGRDLLKSAAIKKADLIIMSASCMMDTSGTFAKWLDAQDDVSVQADEASRYYKNPASVPYRNLRRATGRKEYVIGYTATPVPNYDDDYFNVLDLFRPGAAGRKEDFRGRWAADQMRGEGRTGVIKRLQSIQKSNRAWVFKKDRGDADVLQFIPPHLPIEEVWDEPEEFAEYNNWIARYCEQRYPAMQAVGQALQLQRQLCVSPALLESRRHPERYKGLSDSEAMARGVADYDGPDPKMEDMVEKCKEFHSESDNLGRVFVVTCQWMGGLDRARVCLEKAGFEPGMIQEYSGRRTDDQCEAARRAANRGDIAVLLLGAQAGGFGLNLQGDEAAGTGPTAMYRLNEMDTADSNSQLVDRISRSGQTRTTTHWLPRIAGTVEVEHIMPLVASKAVVGAVLRHGDNIPDSAFGAGASIERQLEMFGFSEAAKQEVMATIEAKRAQDAEKVAAAEARKKAADAKKDDGPGDDGGEKKGRPRRIKV